MGGFPGSIADAALHADNWTFESGSESPTYADAVIVAQLHARIGKPGHTLPNLEAVPHFANWLTVRSSPTRVCRSCRWPIRKSKNSKHFYIERVILKGVYYRAGKVRTF